MNLDFLKDVQLEEIKKTATVKKQSTPKLPTEADIRVFSNGKIYPSEAFAKANNLEYGTRGEDKKPVGNGMDIFSSDDWSMINNLPQTVIFGAVVPKELPKVDVWASTKYEADGTPKSSVLTQGNSTFVKDRLLPMLASAYEINWDEVEYADFKFVTSQPLVSANGIYIVPKVVSTGAKKGQPDYIRRENINVCPIILVSTSEAVVPQNADLPPSEEPAQPEAASPEQDSPMTADAMFSDNGASDGDVAVDDTVKGKGWSRAAMEASS